MSNYIKMKAAFVLSPNEVTIAEATLPPLGENEVLVKVQACGICASDVKFFKGMKTYAETPYGWSSPGFTGHEWVGEVTKVGERVQHFNEGEIVSPFLIISCGSCKFCLRGRVNLCFAKRYLHGGFAEYVKAPAENLIKIPKGVSIEDACLTEPLACCLNCYERLNLRSDDTVVVLGDGPMGLLNLQVLKSYGHKVILVGHHAERLKMAKRLGADVALNSLETNPVEAVMELTDRYGVDAVIAAVSAPESMKTAMQLVSRGGKICVFAGAHPSYEFMVDVNRVHYQELTIYGSADALRQHYLKALDMMSKGSLKPSAIITHTFPLDRIGEAIVMALKRWAIKIIIKP